MAAPETVNVQDQGTESLACIAGIGLRLPGANNLSEFSQLLLDGSCMIGPARYPMYGVTQGCGQVDSYGKLDCGYFNMGYEEVSESPAMLGMLLEVVAECIMDSGLKVKDVAHHRTGFYLGVTFCDTDCLCKPACSHNYHNRTQLTSQVTSHFDLTGPSVQMDGACASSFAALHSALLDLQQERCELAIVAGANLIEDPMVSLLFEKLSMTSPTGQSRPFDKDADGYVRSDGVVALLLKRSMYAPPSKVYCDIVGFGLQCDGYRNTGIIHPNSKFQAKLLTDIYTKYNLDVNDLLYVEAHGTSTQKGDKAECKALQEAICSKRKSPLVVGSVKGNIGHTEAAAGVAGIAKCLASMKCKAIFKSVNYNIPNPTIRALHTGHIIVPQSTCAMGLRESLPYLMGVTSMGFGGLAGHVVLRKCEPNPVAKNKELPPLVIPLSLQLTADNTVLLNDDLQKELKNASFCRYLLGSEMCHGTAKTLLNKSFLVSDPQNDTVLLSKCSNLNASSVELTVAFSDFLTAPWSPQSSILDIPCVKKSFLKYVGLSLKLQNALLSFSCGKVPDFLEEGGIVLRVAAQMAMVDFLKEMNVSHCAQNVLGDGIGTLAVAYMDGCLTTKQCIGIAGVVEDMIHREEKIHFDRSILKVWMDGDEVYQLGPWVQILKHVHGGATLLSLPSHLVDKLISELESQEHDYQQMKFRTPLFTSQAFSDNVKKELKTSIQGFIHTPAYWSTRVEITGIIGRGEGVHQKCDAEFLTNLFLTPWDEAMSCLVIERLQMFADNFCEYPTHEPMENLGHERCQAHTSSDHKDIMLGDPNYLFPMKSGSPERSDSDSCVYSIQARLGSAVKNLHDLEDSDSAEQKTCKVPPRKPGSQSSEDDVDSDEEDDNEDESAEDGDEKDYDDLIEYRVREPLPFEVDSDDSDDAEVVVLNFFAEEGKPKRSFCPEDDSCGTGRLDSQSSDKENEQLEDMCGSVIDVPATSLGFLSAIGHIHVAGYNVDAVQQLSELTRYDGMSQCYFGNFPTHYLWKWNKSSVMPPVDWRIKRPSPLPENIVHVFKNKNIMAHKLPGLELVICLFISLNKYLAKNPSSTPVVVIMDQVELKMIQHMDHFAHEVGNIYGRICSQSQKFYIEKVGQYILQGQIRITSENPIPVIWKPARVPEQPLFLEWQVLQQMLVECDAMYGKLWPVRIIFDQSRHYELMEIHAKDPATRKDNRVFCPIKQDSGILQCCGLTVQSYHYQPSELVRPITTLVARSSNIDSSVIRDKIRHESYEKDNLLQVPNTTEELSARNGCLDKSDKANKTPKFVRFSSMDVGTDEKSSIEVPLTPGSSAKVFTGRFGWYSCLNKITKTLKYSEHDPPENVSGEEKEGSSFNAPPFGPLDIALALSRGEDYEYVTSIQLDDFLESTLVNTLMSFSEDTYMHVYIVEKTFLSSEAPYVLVLYRDPGHSDLDGYDLKILLRDRKTDLIEECSSLSSALSIMASFVDDLYSSHVARIFAVFERDDAPKSPIRSWEEKLMDKEIEMLGQLYWSHVNKAHQRKRVLSGDLEDYLLEESPDVEKKNSSPTSLPYSKSTTFCLSLDEELKTTLSKVISVNDHVIALVMQKPKTPGIEDKLKFFLSPDFNQRDVDSTSESDTVSSKEQNITEHMENNWGITQAILASDETTLPYFISIKKFTKTFYQYYLYCRKPKEVLCLNSLDEILQTFTDKSPGIQNTHDVVVSKFNEDGSFDSLLFNFWGKGVSTPTIQKSFEDSRGMIKVTDEIKSPISSKGKTLSSKVPTFVLTSPEPVTEHKDDSEDFEKQLSQKCSSQMKKADGDLSTSIQKSIIEKDSDSTKEEQSSNLSTNQEQTVHSSAYPSFADGKIDPTAHAETKTDATITPPSDLPDTSSEESSGDTEVCSILENCVSSSDSGSSDFVYVDSGNSTDTDVYTDETSGEKATEKGTNDVQSSHEPSCGEGKSGNSEDGSRAENTSNPEAYKSINEAPKTEKVEVALIVHIYDHIYDQMIAGVQANWPHGNLLLYVTKDSESGDKNLGLVLFDAKGSHHCKIPVPQEFSFDHLGDVVNILLSLYCLDTLGRLSYGKCEDKTVLVQPPIYRDTGLFMLLADELQCKSVFSASYLPEVPGDIMAAIPKARVHSGELNPYSVSTLTEGRGCDVVMVFTVSRETDVNDYLEMVAKGGSLIMFGYPDPVKSIGLRPFLKNISVHCVSPCHAVRQCMELNESEYDVFWNKVVDLCLKLNQKIGQEFPQSDNGFFHTVLGKVTVVENMFCPDETSLLSVLLEQQISENDPESESMAERYKVVDYIYSTMTQRLEPGKNVTSTMFVSEVVSTSFNSSMHSVVSHTAPVTDVKTERAQVHAKAEESESESQSKERIFKKQLRVHVPEAVTSFVTDPIYVPRPVLSLVPCPVGGDSNQEETKDGKDEDKSKPEGVIRVLEGRGFPVPDGLQDLVDSAQHEIVVKLNDVTKGTPMVLVHPLMGTADCFKHLAELLCFPVYGLQYASKTHDDRSEGLQDVAKFYLSEMEKISSLQGEFVLGAYSFGCVIAWEMAQMLKGTGRMVKLVLIDGSYAYVQTMLEHELQFVPQDSDALKRHDCALLLSFVRIFKTENWPGLAALLMKQETSQRMVEAAVDVSLGYTFINYSNSPRKKWKLTAKLSLKQEKLRSFRESISSFRYNLLSCVDSHKHGVPDVPTTPHIAGDFADENVDVFETADENVNDEKDGLTGIHGIMKPFGCAELKAQIPELYLVEPVCSFGETGDRVLYSLRTKKAWMFLKLGRMFHEYRPQPLHDVPCALVQVKSPPNHIASGHLEVHYGLEPLVSSEKLQLAFIEGDHYTCLQLPNVKDLAVTLTNLI